MRIFTILTVLLCAAAASGCSSTRVRSAADPSAIPRTAAYLPPEYPRTVQRERVDRVWSAVRSEIANEGYLLLDQPIVDRVCAGRPGCDGGRSELAERHGVRGFFTLDLTAASRNNFVAGYYNAISGTLTLLGAAGEELAVVEHSERERGGLLFNTGQLVTGLVSQVANADEEQSTGLLAARFAQGITAGLPAPGAGPAPDAGGEAARIESVRLDPLGSSYQRVCARTNGEGEVFLLAGKYRANLRRFDDGEFCGAYRLSDFEAREPLALEYRTPFGDIDRQPLQIALERPCELQGSVKIVPRENGREISVTCDTGAVLVYRAPSVAGPFRRIRSAPASRVVDTSTQDGADPVYAVVAVTKDGASSVPVVVR